MLTIIAVLLFLIFLAIAMPQVLLKLALVIAWPIDMVLLLIRLPFLIVRIALGGVLAPVFKLADKAPSFRTILAWGLLALLVLDMGGHLVYWTIYGWPEHPFI